MWNRALLVSKARAFGLHIAISAIVFAVVIAVVVGMWFPQPYFSIDGGLAMVAIAAAVDLGIGPLITFLVYRPGRRDNKLNFAVIGVLQAAALAWGVHVLYTQRPLYAAYIGGPVKVFIPITEELIRKSAPPSREVQERAKGRPPLVFVPLSSDKKKALGMLMSGFLGGPSLLSATHLWLPIEGRALDSIVEEARDRKTLESLDPDAGRLLDEFLAGRGAKFEDFAFVPLRGRFSSALLALNKADGSLAGVVYANVRPE